MPLKHSWPGGHCAFVKQRSGELWLKVTEIRDELLGGQMPLGGHGVPSGHTVPERQSNGVDEGNERTEELRTEELRMEDGGTEDRGRADDADDLLDEGQMP